MKKTLKNNAKGITLIALVITIIVLLILAGVAISMLSGENGILNKAADAKVNTDKASEDEESKLTQGESVISKFTEKTPMSDDALNDALGKTGSNIITNNTTVAKVVDGVPIPIGFTHLKETEKDTGLVIIDGYGNHFVWVPVADTSKMFTKDGNGNYKATTIDEPSTVTSDSYVSTINSLLKNETSYGKTLDEIERLFQDEYNAMAKSVEKYGGFYVGRYETSWTGKKVASVAGVTPMYGYTPLDTITDPNTEHVTGDAVKDGLGSTWYTFYREQKALYKKSADSSVVSGMIYGSQWDAIMDWLSTSENEAIRTYVTNSAGMGWFSGVAGNDNHLTGLDLNGGKNKVNNIYDLAGNFKEWTQEDSNLSDDAQLRINRGGHYGKIAEECSASYRSEDHPAHAGFRDTSRLQLYIK